MRLEDDFWRIRTDTGELADAERNALRGYLDEKGFKNAIIDDNLVIAGELTWQEVVEAIEAFYEGKADVFHSERGKRSFRGSERSRPNKAGKLPTLNPRRIFSMNQTLIYHIITCLRIYLRTISCSPPHRLFRRS